jgi:hypothetical protein
MKLIRSIGPISIRAYFGRQKKVADARHIPQRPFRGYCYGSWIPRVGILPGARELVAALKGHPLVWWRPSNGVDISFVWAFWHLAIHTQRRRRA